MNKLFLSIALVATLCSAAIADHDPQWEGIYMTFKFGVGGYEKGPTHTNHPLMAEENWGPLPNGSACNEGDLFIGFQYIKQNDHSVVLIYDVQGSIAGIQMLIPQNVVKTPTNTLKYDLIPMYQNATYDGEDYYVLTAYLVDPSTICTTGRDASSLEQETGTGLWLLNGTYGVVQVPKNRPESDETATQPWTKNNCFPGMGYHNFYSIQQYRDTSCTEMVPIFGLYNHRSNQLHGFGFITVGNITNPRFEQPPEAAIKLILGAGRIPQCVIDIQKREVVSSLHVFFTEKPGLTDKNLRCRGTTIVSYTTVLVEWFGNGVMGLIGVVTGIFG